MSSRYQTSIVASGSIAAGATLNINTTGLPSLFNIHKVTVVPDSAGGSFDYRIYKADTFAAAKLLAFWDNVANGTTGLVDPMDDTSGVPAAALEGASIPYDDDDDTGELHHQIINGDGTSHTYTVTVTYEEVPLMTAAGGATFRDVVLAAAGTVSLPAFAFSADTDTGMYRIGANNLGLAAGGVSVFNATATTINLPLTTGIGGTPTTGMLDVFGTGIVSAQFRVTHANGGYIQIYDSTNTTARGFIGYGSNTFSGAAITDFGINSAAALTLGTNSGTVALTIDTSQRVGIGMSPEARFNVGTSTAGGIGGSIYIDNPATSTLNNETQIAFGNDVGAAFSGVSAARLRTITTNAVSGAVSFQIDTWDGSVEGTGLLINSSRQTLFSDGIAAAPSVAGINYTTTGRAWAAGPIMTESIGGVAYWEWGSTYFGPIAASDNAIDAGRTTARYRTIYAGTALAVGLATNLTGNFYAGSDSLVSVYLDTAVTSAVGSTFTFRKARGMQASRTIVADDDVVGSFDFQAIEDATDYRTVAQIIAKVGGTPGAAVDMPGKLEFYTTPDASTTPALAMTITRTQTIAAGVAANAVGHFYAGSNVQSSVYYDTAVDSAVGSALLFRKARGTQAARTIVADGDTLGSLYFYGIEDATDYRIAAQIQAKIDGTPGAATDMPGRLEFYTTPDGSVTPTLAMTINSSQNLGLGTQTFGTSAAKVLGIFNGTEPSTSPADMVQLYSVDLSADNATLGLRTETAVAVEALLASTHTLSVRINGTTYKVLLST